MKLHHEGQAVASGRIGVPGPPAVPASDAPRLTSPDVDFRILGPLEALAGGGPLALRGSKQRALLGLLLLHANEPLSTDRLIDELWGERPPATAVKTVQVHVSRLRKALFCGAGDGADDPLVTCGRSYEMRLDPERLDSFRFERLVAAGRRTLAARRPSRAAAALDEALGLWRGAPLADFADEPFAQREIARLGALRVDAFELLIEAQLALGQHSEVIGRLEWLIGEHPYRERLRAQLMLALYRSERQADALQAYQDARRQMVDELGIEPGEWLRELERAILAQTPAGALPAVELPPTVPTPRPQPKEAALIYLIVGLDRNTLSPWHENIGACDVATAKRIALGRATAQGINPIVAAVIGPNLSVLSDPELGTATASKAA